MKLFENNKAIFIMEKPEHYYQMRTESNVGEDKYIDESDTKRFFDAFKYLTHGYVSALTPIMAFYIKENLKALRKGKNILYKRKINDTDKTTETLYKDTNTTVLYKVYTYFNDKNEKSEMIEAIIDPYTICNILINKVKVKTEKIAIYKDFVDLSVSKINGIDLINNSFSVFENDDLTINVTVVTPVDVKNINEATDCLSCMNKEGVDFYKLHMGNHLQNLFDKLTK